MPFKNGWVNFAPDELENAPVPDHHHLPEALARPLRVLVPVGEHIGSVFGRHFECFIKLTVKLLTHFFQMSNQ